MEQDNDIQVGEHLAELKPEHQKFVLEYCRTLNREKAAVEAGYAEGSARNQAYRLMQREDVREAVRQELAARAMSQEEAIVRLTEWGRGSLERLFTIDVNGAPRLDLSSMSEADWRLIKEIEVTSLQDAEGIPGRALKVKIKTHDALAAVKELLRVHGAVSDAPQVTVATSEDIARFLGLRVPSDDDDA